MRRREKKKQDKIKARQERLRQEKHARTSPTAASEHKFAPAQETPRQEQAAVAHAPKDPAIEPPDAPLDNFFLGEPAREWLDALLAGTDSNPLVKVLWAAEMPADLMLKATVCCEILVAAEMIAAGCGRPSRHLPPRAAAWLIERDLAFTPGVLIMAAMAVRRVGDFSELRHAWDTVNLADKWLPGVDCLHRRLQR